MKVGPSYDYANEDLRKCMMAVPAMPRREGVEPPHPMTVDQTYYERKHTYKHLSSKTKWCCIPINAPKTDLRCPKKDHPLYYIEVNEVPYRCNLCQINRDEFLRCNDCDFDICLHCLSVEESYGYCGLCKNGICFKFPCCCLSWTTQRKLPKRPKNDKFCCCGLINLSAAENKLKDEVEEKFNDVEGQVSSLFQGLQGDKENQDKYLTELFEKFDEDGSGALEMAELQNFLGAYISENYGTSLEKAVDIYKEKSDKFWVKIFQKIDANGDGSVDKGEFLDVILPIFFMLEKMMLAAIQKMEDEAIEKIDELDGEKSIPFVKRSLQKKLQMLKDGQKKEEEVENKFADMLNDSDFDFDLDEIKKMIKEEQEKAKQLASEARASQGDN